MRGTANGHDASSAAAADDAEAMNAELTSPTALRKLVLNYLIHHCYVDTAQAFADDGISTASSSSLATATMNGGGHVSQNGSGGIAHASGSRRSTNGSAAAPRTLSSRSAAASSAAGSAHPLSAPPLSRQDSTMEVEVDSLLALASAGGPGASGAEAGHSSAAASSGHGEELAITNNRHGDDTNNGNVTRTGHADVTLGNANQGSEELSAEELHTVRIRKDVRDHIVAGRIRQAVDLCNRYFPTVLNANTDTTTSTSATPSATTKQDAKATAAHASRSSWGGEKEKSKTDASSGEAIVERILPANPTSLDPAHLSLNLQIQAFIESVRAASSSSTATSPTTAPVVPSPGAGAHQGASAMPSMHSIVSNTPGIAAAAVSRSASPAPSSASSTGSATSANGLGGSTHSNGGSSTVINPVLHTALRLAQSLYSDVQQLPAYWRAMYLKELESVTTVLAYTDLERSPVRKYLDQSRRVALAEQINSAIMLRTGKPSQPLIESAVRQTTFCWSALANDKVVVPSSHWLFSSGTVVGLDNFDSTGPAGSSTALSTSTSAKSIGNGKGKTVPSWDLHSFLRER